VWGTSIATWPRWILLQSVLLLAEGLAAGSQFVFGAWYRQTLFGDCTHTALSRAETMVLMQTWHVAQWVPTVLRLFVVITTRQLQFLLPGFLVKRAVTAALEYQRLRTKTPACA